eukprot:CAMPEP_0198267382 /NCGR_PEP_ID=MMETSP1447-20131203/32803_1 /TAXON_ID=420782 /ORGANISM="Chaetoceros dichaeta, Strain CCMP1751" /LENGTH=177 /DNA_ID=CAMNT_0043957949 /DNA_START=67 /DNA_END=600 /DNA_ORIENTATION=-
MNLLLCSALLLFATLFSAATGFAPASHKNTNHYTPKNKQHFGVMVVSMSSRPDFEFSFDIPKKGIADVGTAEVKLPPLLENSEIVVVRYDLPFGLNAASDDGSGPSGQVQVVVGADGKNGGEKVGDILRQTTYWRGKQPGIFDVSKNADNFDLVVQALVTNDLQVADEIVLVFERPL